MNSLPSLASRLNRDCACELLDTQALQRALHADSVLAAWWPHWQDTHAHLFSGTGLFVSREQLQAMQEAVQVLHTVMTQAAWCAQALPTATQSTGPLGVFMGYDFHLTESGPKLIEINTNAGGAMLALALTRAQRACCDETQTWLPTATDVAQIEADWLRMFAHEWALQHPDQAWLPAADQPLGAAPPRCVAIVDEQPSEQYLYPEFLLFQDLFERAGIRALIAAPQDLQWADGQLRCQGQRVDMVYLRLTDFDLRQPQHAHLLQAWQSGACVFTPNPQVHALHAHKRHLQTLSNPQALSALGVPPAQRELLARVVPHTVALNAENAEALWAERKGYFFKPMSGYGSKAAYRGDKLTHKTWAQMLTQPYVAQALVAPSQRVVRVRQSDPSRKTLKADVRAYAYQGQVQLFAARLYDGQTTNFRSDGGGFAPVFVTPT